MFEKNIKSKNLKAMSTKNGRIMILSKCAVCDNKKSRFVKEEKASGLFSSLWITKPLSRIPIVDLILF